jgi:hypothetical protein
VTALDGIRPGIEGREADALACDIIEAVATSTSATASARGLQPRAARTAEARLVTGHAATVEPGVTCPPWRRGSRIWSW